MRNLGAVIVYKLGSLMKHRYVKRSDDCCMDDDDDDDNDDDDNNDDDNDGNPELS